MTELRHRFLSWGIDQLGTPTLWGAKGDDAFDCSGLVTCGYHHLGLADWRESHNTDTLFEELEPTLDPLPGDLVFWAPKQPRNAGDVEHVGIVLRGGHLLHASGATSRITTLEQARKVGARVTTNTSIHYRPGFAGFRISPFP